jgi:hypothetical protein
VSDPVISGGPPRSREALRFAVELYAGSGQSEQAAVRAADHFSNWLASCPPEPADTTVVGLLHAIIRNQEIIMSNQAEEVSIAAQIEDQVAAINAAQATALTEIAALQAAVVAGTPLDFTALTQAVTDLGTASTGVQTLATAAAAATPPVTS